ncbi:phospholipid-transporting ATPase ABCA3-like [Planococcus citri]|uniref:phospholipid-transporting ATPase ABCA3-like n=1 Tax=Planococcus citri TaxID=170843 RepID=UPI0031F72E61
MRFRKLTLLMWKNYRWRRHFWVWTLIEALVPVFIAIYIPYVILLKPNSWAKSTVTKYQSSFNPTNNKTFILYKTVLTNVLAYTPWNPSNQQIVENVVNILNGLSIEDYENTKKTMTVKNFSSENDLESFMFNRTACGTCIGIVFEQSSHDVFRYKLRLNDFTKTLGSRVLREKPAPAQHDVYVERGFAGIQLLLNEEFIRMQINKTDWHPPEFHPAFLEFPVPEYETSTIPRNGFITIASLSIIITSVALSIPFINAVIQEKETGVMELMKIHGVEEWMIWLSWLIHAFIVPAISLTLMTLVFKTSALSNGIELVRYVSFPALWLLFMMYSLANISFICLFCAIFHKGIVASFTFIVVLIANFLWIAFYHELNLQSTAIFIALIPASAFAIAIETVQKYELLGESFGLTSFGSIFYSVGMLLFDIVLYSLLTLYITSINPGTHGVPKKPLFFLESLLKKDEKKKESTNELQILTGTQINYNESSSSQLRPLITIKNLTKQYGSSYAISAVDLVIYENEIIAVLGHNGAGKTALLTSIAGLSSYDEGTLFYRGAELKDNLDTLRTNLGICFQEDRLFDYLSVADHLKFYAMCLIIGGIGAAKLITIDTRIV